MIRGNLITIILTELNGSSQTGYGLMKNLKEKLGKAPSPGSVYPVLSELLEKGYVLLKEEGRKKEYRISAKGKKLLTQKIQEKEQILEQIIDIIKNANCKESGEAYNLIKFYEFVRHIHGKDLGVVDALSEVRDAFVTHFEQQHSPQAQKQLQQILRETAKQIRELK